MRKGLKVPKEMDYLWKQKVVFDGKNWIVYPSKKSKRILTKVSVGESCGYLSLGIITGTDMFHCFFVGTRLVKEFLRRVVGYRIVRGIDSHPVPTPNNRLEVEFFENSPHQVGI